MSTIIPTKNSRGCKTDYNSKSIPSIRHLTRIIMYLEASNECFNITNISLNCLLSNNTCKKALLWLMNHKLINKKNVKGNTKYYINKKWLKLKNEN